MYRTVERGRAVRVEGRVEGGAGVGGGEGGQGFGNDHNGG